MALISNKKVLIVRKANTRQERFEHQHTFPDFRHRCSYLMARNAAGEAAVTNLSSLKIPEEGQWMKTDLLKKCFSTYQKRCESSTDFSYSSVSQKGGKEKKYLTNQPKKKKPKQKTKTNKKTQPHKTGKLLLTLLIQGQHFKLPLPFETLTSQNLWSPPSVVKNTYQDQVLANTL